SGLVASTGRRKMLSRDSGSVVWSCVPVTDAATATVQVDASSFLELDTAIVSGGILTNAGTVNSLNGTSELDGVATSTSHLVEVTEGKRVVQGGSRANTGSRKLLATGRG